jgi:hypothetical protein
MENEKFVLIVQVFVGLKRNIKGKRLIFFWQDSQGTS